MRWRQGGTMIHPNWAAEALDQLDALWVVLGDLEEISSEIGDRIGAVEVQLAVLRGQLEEATGTPPKGRLRRPKAPV